MDCKIYKGKRKPDHYVFLPGEVHTDKLPDDIKSMLGEMEFVMQLDISLQTTLARSDPASVLNIIQEKGFYIQLPPKQDENKNSQE